MPGLTFPVTLYNRQYPTVQYPPARDGVPPHQQPFPGVTAHTPSPFASLISALSTSSPTRLTNSYVLVRFSFLWVDRKAVCGNVHPIDIFWTRSTGHISPQPLWL
ncbi:hypothetical protein BJX66DRAFT_108312 [Aspergillus keveii]|uniref:Uncharacterized protein n=1 Tax=Aspergillus keveii TaxID=714993 RepID=A0ABR4GE41_9EURO